MWQIYIQNDTLSITIGVEKVHIFSTNPILGNQHLKDN